jgi:FtsP/CotA-like multicopper oxidase with cupredoxin domain
VTEFTPQGNSFEMEWTPTRAGNWLMHCHMIPHITPFPERPDSAAMHDMHDLARHPMVAMSGLVLGIRTTDQRADPKANLTADLKAVQSADLTATPRRLRLFVQRARADTTRKNAAHGYVLQRGAEPRGDSVEVPGSTLVLTRGQRATITVVNRLARPTTVHWHGMELESVYDGVSGWSRSGSSVAPLVAPGDSFTVTFTPPRAGTYMYHTHIDEGPQLRSGMYGPMLVLEPGQRYDPATDLTFMIGDAVVNDSLVLAVNGTRDAPPLRLSVGRQYRLRLINMHYADVATIALLADSTPVAWRAIAKDGADLPAVLATVGPARLERIGVGETYDYVFTPRRAGDLVLDVKMGDERLVRVLRAQ